MDKIEVFANEKAALDAIGGTSYATAMDIDYQKLVDLFGEPHCFDNYKTDAEWVVRYKGRILTIYNYKDGKNYNGARGKATKNIRDWHIGTHDNDQIDRTTAIHFAGLVKNNSIEELAERIVILQ